MPGVFSPEVDQCLCVIPMIEPMSGVFSPKVGQCLGFSPQRWNNAWVFSLEVEPFLGLSLSVRAYVHACLCVSVVSAFCCFCFVDVMTFIAKLIVDSHVGKLI